MVRHSVWWILNTIRQCLDFDIQLKSAISKSQPMMANENSRIALFSDSVFNIFK